MSLKEYGLLKRMYVGLGRGIRIKNDVNDINFNVNVNG